MGINIITGDTGSAKLEAYEKEGVHVNGSFVNGVLEFKLESCNKKTTLMLHLIVNKERGSYDYIGMEKTYPDIKSV
ncbi:MAG: hypothetical protein FWG65_05420 [Turicibacter sp.]|nr:hypothetical protein [Turicibacter sp.]